MDKDLKIALIAGLPGPLLTAAASLVVALAVAHMTNSFTHSEQLGTERRSAQRQAVAESAANFDELAGQIEVMDQTVERHDWAAFLPQARKFREEMDQRKYDRVLGGSEVSEGSNDPSNDFRLLLDVADSEIRWYLSTCSENVKIVDIDRATACSGIPGRYIEPSLRDLAMSLSTRRIGQRFSLQRDTQP